MKPKKPKEPKKPKYQVGAEIHFKKAALNKKEVFEAIDFFRKSFPDAEIMVSELEYNDGVVWLSHSIPDWKFLTKWDGKKWKRQC